MLGPLILTLLAATPGTPSEVQKKEKGTDAMGVPLVSYNSDQGFGFGAVGGAYIYAPGFTPYRHAFAAQVFFTTLGIQNHWVRYDGPSLIGNTRIEARLEHRRELVAPYYGPGNLAAPEATGDPKDKTFVYERFSPGAWFRLRAAPLGEDHPLEPYLGYGYRWTRIETYPGSLLERSSPVGIIGGPTGQFSFGVLWDTRDNEGDPTRGGLEEVALRVSGRPTGSRYSFAGITFIERRYWPLNGDRLVFAQRLAVDVLVGQAPFFEWSAMGGVAGLEGIGGMGSVRGLARQRFGGNIKAITNSEIRFYPTGFPFLGVPVKVGGTAFVDLGRVWHPTVRDGPWYQWHVGFGGGLRLARRAAVLRLDYAVTPERWRQGLYVTFGHAF